MYTLEQLQQKNIKQLKEIGWQLNVFPAGDKRCRQNWIDALARVNPPLLQLLEVSPAAEEVELAAKAIAPAAKTKKRAQKLIAPAAKTKKRVQKPIEEVQALASFKIGDLVKSLTKRRGIKNKSLTGTVVFVHPSGGVRVTFFGGGTLDYSRFQLKDLIVQEPPITKVVNILKLKSPEILDGIAWHFFYQSPEWLQKVLWPRIWDESEDIDFVEMIIRSFCGNRLLGCNFDNIFEIFQRVLAGQEEIQARELARNEKRQARKLEVEAQDPIQVQRQESIVPAGKNFPGVEIDRVQHPIIEMVETSPAASVEQAQEAIAPAAKNLPGSRLKTSTVHQLLELFKSSAHIIEDSPGVKTEVTVSESAIAPAAKNHLDAVESEHPKSKGITFSDRFLARYSPPQSENICFQVGADGQLSLLDFEVQSELEPPDPDDFESLDAFREAIARWDTQNPELLAASIDSMCEWAPCPEEWYWPKAEILPLKASSTIDLSLPSEQSEVMELSIAGESSITCNFFIPTFDAWCDRFNRSDEPLDTWGIFARLPKPTPPKFSPQAASQLQVNQASRNYPETIPKLFHCIAAGSSTQPARSPPGGDALSA
jgi:hypothetical protein